MSHSPLISVVTPTYNSARYLEETLRSVQGQDYGAVEHLVQDGGSTDGTLEILARYPRVRVQSEPDKGLYDALNKGLRAAQGEILGCLNSDDLYEPDTLCKVARLFAEHPEVDVIIGAGTLIDGEGKRLYEYQPLPYSWKRFVSCDFSTIMFPSVFWRRRIHERIGYFDDSYRMAADFEFYTRFKDLMVLKTSALLSRFRNHGESLTYTRHDLSRRETERIFAGLGIELTPLVRLKHRIGKVLFVLACYRPPLVMVGRAARKLMARLR